MRYPIFLVLILLAGLSGGADAEVRSERWHWSNPLPHGNNVMDMLVTTDLAVQVGDAGALYMQRSDERWTPAVTGVQNYLRSIALLNGRIIATGESGCILWSDDGIDFQPAQLTPANTMDWFEGAAASSSRAVAVGDYGTIYTSTNGADWAVASSGTDVWMRDVAFGGEAFVAVGENGTTLRSTDGSIWSPVVSGTSAHLNRIRYLGSGGNKQFIAVGNDGVALRSSTGSEWVPMNSGTTNHLFDAAVNNIGMLLVGDQEIRMSTDGGTSWVDQIVELTSNAAPAWVYFSAHGKSDTWLVSGRTGLLMEGRGTNANDCVWQTAPSYSPRAWLWDLTVQNGIYIAVGDLANINTSLDGILWDQEVVPDSHTNTVLLGVGGTSNLLLAVGNDGNVLTSQAGAMEITVTNQVDESFVITNLFVETYGVVWTDVPAFTTVSLQGVAATQGLFIVTGDEGKIFTSPNGTNGTNWTELTSPTADFLSGVAIGTDACVAVGSKGTLLRAGVDGKTWSAVSLGTTDWLYRVRWLENQFVVVGENGAIHTSPDGATWTARTSGTTSWLTDVTFVDGQWFVSGYQGTLLTSPNLTDWSKLPLPTGKSLFTAATKNGRLVLAGVEGVILRNQVIPETSPVRLLDYSQSIAMDGNSVSTVYELFLFGGMPDQVFEFLSTTNLSRNLWQTNAVLELYDPSGTLYAIRTRDAANAPPTEFYGTQVLP